jgi:hypothetical protein
MANVDASDTQSPTPAKSPKKKYSPPTLTVYGRVTELTAIVGNKTGNIDNPTAGTKTSIG